MSRFEDPSIVTHYQSTRSTASTSRPQSAVPSKDAVTDMFNVGIDNRSQLQRQSSPLSIKRVTRHHVRIPTASLVISPPILNQRTSTPEQNTLFNRPSSASIGLRLARSIPVRLKTTSLSIPPSTTMEEVSYQSFPKQNHEKRKAVHERKRRKQQRQTFCDKQSETETWLRLRRSLVELKRLATTQDILIDPITSLFNCDGHTCTTTTVKQSISEHTEDKKAAIFKSDSGMSSLFGSPVSARDINRPSLTTSQNSFSRPLTAKRPPTETFPRVVFEPLFVASKPIHSSVEKTNPPIRKPPTTAPPRSRSNFMMTLSPEEKPSELPINDPINDDNRSITSSPIPPTVKTEQETSSPKIVTPLSIRTRPPSTNTIASTIKLKSQTPRCRSATEPKPSFITNKNYPRYIIVADEEHRIESWYHQYPFILGDDFITSFDSKQSSQKSIISAYFIDDLQTSNPNITAKTFLQGKPFHTNNDWRKYDLIFISNNIYEQTMVHLKPIINSLKSFGKIIKIQQINHNEDLKKQVRHTYKQLQQQNI